MCALQSFNYEELYGAARNSTWESLVAILRVLTRDYPTLRGLPWVVETSRGKESKGKTFFPPHQKATSEKTTENRMWEFRMCFSRLVGSASPWDTITWTQTHYIFMPRLRGFLRVKNTNGISPMWIIHHIFRESQFLISRHSLCISNPGEVC